MISTLKKSLMVAVLLLAGCASTPQVVMLPSVNEQRAQPVSDMTACPDLTPLSGSLVGDLVNKISEMVPLYKECQAKQKNEADWIKRSSEKNAK
jgi:uncharacterized lipoprotein YmbA